MSSYWSIRHFCWYRCWFATSFPQDPLWTLAARKASYLASVNGNLKIQWFKAHQLLSAPFLSIFAKLSRSSLKLQNSHIFIYFYVLSNHFSLFQFRICENWHEPLAVTIEPISMYIYIYISVFILDGHIISCCFACGFFSVAYPSWTWWSWFRCLRFQPSRFVGPWERANERPVTLAAFGCAFFDETCGYWWWYWRSFCCLSQVFDFFFGVRSKVLWWVADMMISKLDDSKHFGSCFWDGSTRLVMVVYEEQGIFLKALAAVKHSLWRVKGDA